MSKHIFINKIKSYVIWSYYSFGEKFQSKSNFDLLCYKS